jgi:O-antigen/teichoic acid export membrane protein
MSNPKPEGNLTISAFWLISARLVSFVLTLALPLFLVRQLDQVSFGLYKQLFLLLNMIIAILPFGIPMSAFYFFAQQPEKRASIVANVMAWHAALAAGCAAAFTLFPGLLVWLTSEERARSYSALFGWTLALWLMGYFLETLPILNHETKLSSRVVIVAAISRSALLLLAAVVFRSVGALLAAMILQMGVQAILLVSYLRSRFPGFQSLLDQSLFRAQVRYAASLSVFGFLASVQVDFHQIVVSKRFGAEVFALYAVGCTQIPLISILTDSVGPLLIRRVAELRAEDQGREIGKLLLAAARKLALVFFPLYGLLTVTAYEFIVFLFTDNYRASVPFFLVHIGIIPMAIFLFDPLVRAYPEHLSMNTRVKVTIFALMALSIWLATTRFGPIWGVASMIAALLAERVWLIALWGRILGIQLEDLDSAKDLARIFAAAAVAALVTSGVRAWIIAYPPFWILAICGLTYLAAYASLILVLKIPRPEEFDLARKGISRFLPWLAPRRGAV